MKPDEIRAQISSLNEELKTTNKTVELRHSERDLLLSQVEELREQKKKEEESLQKIKDSFQTIQLSHEQQMKLLDEQRAEKENYVTKLLTRCQGLESKESGLKESIKTLKEEKTLLDGIHEELAEAEKSRPLIEAVKKELLGVVDEVSEAKAELDIITRKAERIKQVSDDERKEHLQWLSNSKAKSEETYEGYENLKKAEVKTLKDLKVVERRLKRYWPKDKPFPKLWEQPNQLGA